MRTKSNRWQMFFKIGVLNNFTLFTETHLCWSLFFEKLQIKLFKKKLQHRCFPVNIWEICKSSFFNKAHHLYFWRTHGIFDLSENRLLPNMFTSWLSHVMLLFCLGCWNPALWCFIAIFQKPLLCQLQTVHQVDSLMIGERHAESNTFLCNVVH